MVQREKTCIWVRDRNLTLIETRTKDGLSYFSNIFLLVHFCTSRKGVRKKTETLLPVSEETGRKGGGSGIIGNRQSKTKVNLKYDVIFF